MATQGILRWGFVPKLNQYVVESEQGFASGSTLREAASHLRSQTGYHRPYVLPSPLLAKLLQNPLNK